MNIIIFAIVGLLLVLFAGILFLLFGSKQSSNSQLGSISNMQRKAYSDEGVVVKETQRAEVDLDKILSKTKGKETSSSKLTLQKKLKYARWKLPPIAFYLAQLIISIVMVLIARQIFDLPIVIISLLSGPIFMNWLLNFFINRRYTAFDKDYPAFLLNVVSMLKTGMNTMSALDSAADGLGEQSLVRHEVKLMNERLRFGVSEEKSIGTFGEDIFHPEIELFVQALILSKRVGGKLSDTLDRLATQVRKRQHFRASANSAIGLQRGSIWVIIVIMIALEGYIFWVSPNLVESTFQTDTGWMIFQTSICIILLGIYWIRQITKLKI